MASFVAKAVVNRLAKKAGCSEETVQMVSKITKWGTAIATADLVGVVADRVYTKYKDDKDYVPRCPALLPENMHHYDSDGDEEIEVDGVDKEGHPKQLACIHPFLNLALAAYEDTSMAEKFPFVKSSRLIHDLKEPTELRFGISTDTEVHVCVLEDGTLAFAFRGTEPMDWKSPLSDIFSDLEQSQVPVEHYNGSGEVAYKAQSSAEVHKGFLQAFQDVTKTPRHSENLRLVAEGLGVKEADVKRVVCTGHSLGGALATLCAHWCRFVAYENAEIWCVTIGSPRVGNRAFAKEFNENVMQRKNSYRLVNKGDVVPWMPHLGTYPKVWTLYKHVEGLIYLCEHSKSKDTIFLKRGGRRPIFTIPSFLDHLCIAYFNSIDKVLASFYEYGPPRLTLPPMNQ